jgi:hypothetical protein
MGTDFTDPQACVQTRIFALDEFCRNILDLATRAYLIKSYLCNLAKIRIG